MIKVKVCGMTQQAQVDALVVSGVSYVGFIFYPKSKRYLANAIQIDNQKAIPVGVFVNASFDDIQTELKKVPTISTLQLHGDESPEYCAALKEYFTIIKAISVEEDTDINTITEKYSNCCDYFLFDTKTELYGGSGKQFEWNKINEYKGHIPFFISGGIGINDAEQMNKITHDKLYACDVNSKFETASGVKNIDVVYNFLQKINIK